MLRGVGIGGRAAMVASTVETTSSKIINGVVEAALLETFNFGLGANLASFTKSLLVTRARVRLPKQQSDATSKR